MAGTLDQLKSRLQNVHNLQRAGAVMMWDQQTYMPPGGASARGDQIATVSRLAHELFVDDETGMLLDGAAADVARLPADDDDVRLVQVVRRDYEHARRVPSELVAEIAQHSVLANEVWVRARAEDDFRAFAPCLERTVSLSRAVAEHLGYKEHLYDALLDQYEPGMKTSQVQTIFAELKEGLVPLVAAISPRVDRVDDSVLHQPFDEVKQERFARLAVERCGYDFSRGRLDRSPHPFEITVSRNDVRITTHFDPTFLNSAVFGMLHEAGHAMYEQGIGESLEGTALADGASLGVHESQSRLWENVVGRSRPFWQHFYPQLQQTFPGQLDSVELEQFYRAINRVAPSYIRVEADEVTYNLHIMLRFEMELELLEGQYPVQDAPEIWDQKMLSYLGLPRVNDSVGILQDMHWSGGLMGYFPTYTLGNILSVQLYEQALRAIPAIPEQIGQGEFSSLRGWLTDQVYQHGRKFEPNELIERVTGEGLRSRPYLNYLRTKYGEIYGL